MTRCSIGELALLVVLLVANVGTGAALVIAKHESRSLFQEYELLKREQDRLSGDWSALKLEVSYLAGHSRIYEIARDDLGMEEPGDRLRFLVPER